MNMLCHANCRAMPKESLSTFITSPEVHGIGAVGAAKFVELGIRSLVQLRQAVEKHQVHLDAAQEPCYAET